MVVVSFFKYLLGSFRVWGSIVLCGVVVSHLSCCDSSLYFIGQPWPLHILMSLIIDYTLYLIVFLGIVFKLSLVKME